MKGTKSSPWPKQELNIQYGKPNYWNEWSEISDAKRGEQSVYDEFFALGKKDWIDLVKKGKMEKYTMTQVRKIENTEAGIKNKFKT